MDIDTQFCVHPVDRMPAKTYDSLSAWAEELLRKANLIKSSIDKAKASNLYATLVHISSAETDLAALRAWIEHDISRQERFHARNRL
jgi:hypothetical protein